MKILCVEDNLPLAEQVKDALVQQRYTVDVASEGEEGWELIQSVTYDLVLLDIELPKLDGISLCRRLRSRGYSMPVLFLTGRDSDADKVTGLDSGGDDYLVKPFGLAELSARIRALLRRGRAIASPILEWGNLRLDPGSYRVTYGEKAVSVTPKEYALLELFLRNPQRVQSRRTILEQLWSMAEDPPNEDTVKAHVKGLRHKLRPVGAVDLIETVYGLGYRLNQAYQNPR
jgi:two-component system, OmpR family, response regulator